MPGLLRAGVSTLRDQLVAAPLKQPQLAPPQRHLGSALRDQLVAAPLKRKYCGNSRHSRPSTLRDQLVAAPLKRRPWTFLHLLPYGSPRPIGRGPIEAPTSRAAAAPSRSSLRDQLVAAPLKHVSRHLQQRIDEPLRDQLVAAPLKRKQRERCGLSGRHSPRPIGRGPIEAVVVPSSAVPSQTSLRDQLVAAPLKPGIVCYCQPGSRCPLRDQLVAAPLKRREPLRRVRFRVAPLRDQLVAAPLKRQLLGECSIGEGVPLRDQLVAAPLKQASRIDRRSDARRAL